MSSKLYFKDSWKYFFPRHYSPEKLRRFLIHKAGGETFLECYKPNLNEYASKLVILPERAEELAVFLPFLLYLSQLDEKNKLLFISPLIHQSLLKFLQLDQYSHFYAPEHFKYGEFEFQATLSLMKEQEADILFFLDSQYPLLSMYLSLACKAKVRFGIGSEDQYPFVNISLRSPSNISRYADMQTLLNHFKLKTQDVMTLAREKAHGLSKHSDEVVSHGLSTQNVLLINMEPDLDGKFWTREEISMIASLISGKHRLLALFPAGQNPKNFQSLLDEFQIRTAPVPSGSGALLDLIRQYKGAITLNSEHAHLCLNLGHTPLMLLQTANEHKVWLPEKIPPHVTIQERDKAITKETFQSFLGES